MAAVLQTATAAASRTASAGAGDRRTCTTDGHPACLTADFRNAIHRSETMHRPVVTVTLHAATDSLS